MQELNFTTSADLYTASGSSSSDDSMLFENNSNMMQFHIVDGNGNNVKIQPTVTYAPGSQETPLMAIEQNTNEALQLSLANEVEIGAPWVDISVLANKSVIPSQPVTSSCVALSTAIPTYVNLPTYQAQADVMSFFTGATDDQTMNDLNDLLLTDGFDSTGKTLKSITADAGICQCTNCKCDPMQEGGCVGGCGPAKPCKTNSAKLKEQSQMEINTKQLIDEIDSLNVDTTKPQTSSSPCDCKDLKDGVDKGCCVVICLKTLETVKADREHGCGERNRKTAATTSTGFNNLTSYGI